MSTRHADDGKMEGECESFQIEMTLLF